MSHKFLNLAQRAANFPECTMLVDNTLDILGKQIEEKINACASTSSYPCTAPTNTSLLNDSLSTAHLKKKEVETRSSKRTRIWLDKKKKFRKKWQNTATPQVWEEADSGDAQAQEQVAHDIVSRDKVKESQGYKDNISFTQMLMVTYFFYLISRWYKRIYWWFFYKKLIYLIYRNHWLMMSSLGLGEVLQFLGQVKFLCFWWATKEAVCKQTFCNLWSCGTSLLV